MRVTGGAGAAEAAALAETTYSLAPVLPGLLRVLVPTALTLRRVGRAAHAEEITTAATG